MDMQVVTACGLKNFDHIILDRRHYIVLSKNLVPVRSGSEIGFCINFMAQGRRDLRESGLTCAT